jgi:hypothetical protein
MHDDDDDNNNTVVLNRCSAHTLSVLRHKYCTYTAPPIALTVNDVPSHQCEPCCRKDDDDDHWRNVYRARES